MQSVIRAELAKVQEQLPCERDQLKELEQEVATKRALIKVLEHDERVALIALEEKPAPRKRKKKVAPDPEKPKRGRPPKTKEAPPSADAPAPKPPAEPEATKQLYPEDAEVRCTRVDPPCGWFGKRTETKGDRCPREYCHCFVAEITEEERV
jgi:hypothetical protein